jgi:hypothetical protein
VRAGLPCDLRLETAAAVGYEPPLPSAPGLRSNESAQARSKLPRRICSRLHRCTISVECGSQREVYLTPVRDPNYPVNFRLSNPMMISVAYLGIGHECMESLQMWWKAGCQIRADR